MKRKEISELKNKKIEDLNKMVVSKKLEAEKAENTRKELALSKGLLVGPSSGAVYYVAQEIKKNNPGKNIITIFPDRGERYLYYWFNLIY